MKPGDETDTRLPEIFVGESIDTEDGLHIDLSPPLPGPVPDWVWDITPPADTHDDGRNRP